MIELIIGFAVGVGATGYVAHRWPQWFNAKVTVVADQVNSTIDSAKK